MRCVYYGGPEDGAEHEVGTPLPPETLMPARPVAGLHAFATPAETLAFAGPDVERVRYWLARHAVTGAPIYVLADILTRDDYERNMHIPGSGRPCPNPQCRDCRSRT